MSPRHFRISAGVVSLLCVAAAADAQSPNGRPQTLMAHRPSHKAPISTLPDASPLPDGVTARRYSGTPVDVLTYHYDNGRTGWNQSETDLTPATVASAQFGLIKTLKVDGNVFAEPLMVSGFVLPDGSTHDVLIVATGHNTVYAYDAHDYGILWQVSLGKAQSTQDVGCSDVQPEYGISSTPVILRASAGSAALYVVAATEPSSFNFHTQLHALDLGTGKDVQPPVEIAPSATLSDGSSLTFDPQNQWSRTSLATANNAIYVGIGSHCDNNENAISGWMLNYSPTLVAQGAFHTIETPSGGSELASIWMGGFAPSIDPQGNLFVVTGNGAVAGRGKDWGESALSLTPKLDRVRGHFTPSSFRNLNAGDQDFGSGGIMLLPSQPHQTTPKLAVAIGKPGVLYLLDQARLGGLKPNDTGALQATSIVQNGNPGTWGGPAYAEGAAGPTVYVQTDADVLRAFSVSDTSTPALTQRAAGTTTAGYGGSLPIVSSNATTTGTGIVWLIRRSVPMALEAYDAEKLGAPVFSGNAGVWSNIDNENSFVTPLEANGRVYAPAYKTVKVFGLKK